MSISTLIEYFFSSDDTADTTTDNVSESQNDFAVPLPLEEEPAFDGLMQKIGLIGYLIYAVQILIIAAVLGVVLYYSFKFVFSYRGAKSYTVSITFASNKELCVGETIMAKLSFFKVEENRQETPCSPSDVDLINANLFLQLYESGIKLPVEILKTYSQEKDAFVIRFSLRKSGNYELFCLHGFFHCVGSPLTFDVLSGPIYPKLTSLNVPNPEIITVVVDEWTYFGLISKDRYGNVCPMEEGFEDKFQFKARLGDSPVDTTELESLFFNQGSNLVLKIKGSLHNVYKCSITFLGVPIQHGTILLVCMSSCENETFRSGLTNYFLPIPGACKGTLLSVGLVRQQKPTEIWMSVNYRQVAISSLLLGVMCYPFMAFCINTRTKVKFHGLHEIDANDNEAKICLNISDGIQDSVTVAVAASSSRIFLATFGHYQALKLKNVSFEEKQNVLKSELGGFFPFRLKKSYQILILSSGDIVSSSIEAAPANGDDWLKPFIINISRGTPTKQTHEHSQTMQTEKWLSTLVEKLFGIEDGRGDGLFVNIVKNRTSIRLHPNRSSKLNSKWTQREMEFAGTVLAKCVYDSVCWGMCINLSKLKLSQSFLTQLIGAPVTYHCFETDDPTFYEQHILPILDCEEDETNFRFEVPSIIPDSAGVSLIPNGNNIPVNKRNKFHYLDLLANELLKNQIKDEIASFRLGFYKIIPQGLIADLDQDELKKLIYGGGKEFRLEDLKEHCRIVGDVFDTAGSSDTDIQSSRFSESEQQKILRWFWVIISNMSKDEHEQLVKMTTGSKVLPSCGFKELNPKFTIALNGCYNQRPNYHPTINQMSIGNHSTFEKFEKNIIDSLYEELGRKKVEEHLVEINDNNTDGQVETDAMEELDCIPWLRAIYDQSGVRNCVIQ